MRLADVDGHFLETNGAKTETMPAEGHLSMLCPKCFSEKGPAAGVHRIICRYGSGPSHWHAAGTSLEDFTFVPPGNISVAVVGGCAAHFLVVNGEIRFV
jgi:hypothetical protein